MLLYFQFGNTNNTKLRETDGQNEFWNFILISNLYFVNNNVTLNQFQENYNVAVLKVF